MSIFEPRADPVIENALLQLAAIVILILLSAAIIFVSSIVGIARARRRMRNGVKSNGAIVLAATATIISCGWLLYWVINAIEQKENPIDGMLAINLCFILFPAAWLISAIKAARKIAPHQRAVT